MRHLQSSLSLESNIFSWLHRGLVQEMVLMAFKLCWCWIAATRARQALNYDVRNLQVLEHKSGSFLYTSMPVHQSINNRSIYMLTATSR